MRTGEDWRGVVRTPYYFLLLTTPYYSSLLLTTPYYSLLLLLRNGWASVKFCKSREDTVREANEVDMDIKIFTDRSEYEGGIGATAVIIPKHSRVRKLKLHIGMNGKQIVYSGELSVLSLSTHLLCMETTWFNTVFFGTDNQAGIRATDQA